MGQRKHACLVSLFFSCMSLRSGRKKASDDVSSPAKRRKKQEDEPVEGTTEDEPEKEIENGLIYYKFTPETPVTLSTCIALKVPNYTPDKSVSDLVLAHDQVMEFYNRVKNHFQLKFDQAKHQVQVLVVAHRALTIPMWMEFIASLLPNRLKDVVCFIPKSSRDPHVQKWLEINLKHALVKPAVDGKYDEFLNSVRKNVTDTLWDNDKKTRNLLLIDVGGKFTNPKFLEFLCTHVDNNVRVSIVELTENGHQRYEKLLKSDVLPHLYIQSVKLANLLLANRSDVNLFNQHQEINMELQRTFLSQRQILHNQKQEHPEKLQQFEQALTQLKRQQELVLCLATSFHDKTSDFKRSLSQLNDLQLQQVQQVQQVQDLSPWLSLCNLAQTISLMSIARHEIKETEDYNVGRAIAEALDVELRLRKQTYLGNNLTIVVIGFGKIGAAAAETAAAKTHLPVIVVEWNPVRALKAAALSFPVMTLEEALPKAHAIISCTGAQVLRKEHQELLRDQVYIAACTSLEDEIHDSFFEYDTAESIASQAPQDPTDNLTTRDYATKTFNVVNKTINFIYGGVDGSYIHSVLASLVLCAVKGVQTPKPLGLEIPELKYDDAKNMAFFLTQSCVDSRPILSPNIEPDFIRQASEFSFDGDPSDTKRLVEFSKDYDLQAAVCEVWSDHPGAGKSFLARQFAQRSRRYQVVWMFDLDLPGPPQSTKFIKAINARFYNDPKHKDLRFKWQKPHEPDTDHRKQGLVDYLLTNASLHNLSMLIVLDHCRGEDVISIQKYTKQLQEENLVTRSLHFVVLHCGDPPKEILTQPKLVSSLSLSTYQRLVDFYCLMSMSKEQNGRQKKWQDWLDAHKTRLPVFSNFAVAVALSCRFNDPATGIPSQKATLDDHLLQLLNIIVNAEKNRVLMFAPSNGLPDENQFFKLLKLFFENRKQNKRPIPRLEAEKLVPACQVLPELVRIHDDRIACCVSQNVLAKFIQGEQQEASCESTATIIFPDKPGGGSLTVFTAAPPMSG
eukprot:m.260122 g.260122  ORF g.260122 m.260122 type:complete len:1015 (+) comp26777_c0_seq11:62-3106(+)